LGQYCCILLQNDIALEKMHGVVESLRLANLVDSQQRYVLTSCSPSTELVVPSEQWATLSATYTLATLPPHIDTLILPPLNSTATEFDEGLLHLLRQRAGRLKRIVAIGNGLLLAVAMGAADGVRVAADQETARRLASLSPETLIVTDKGWHKEGKLWSASNPKAAVALFLDIIRDDLGAAFSGQVSRMMEAGATPRTRPLPTAAEPAASPATDRVVAWVRANPAADLSLASLARLVAMTEKTLSRTFKQRTGTTIGEFVLSARMDHARRLLTGSERTIKAIASLSGLGSPENMRRLFQERLGCSPGEFRRLHTRSASDPPATPMRRKGDLIPNRPVSE